MAMTPLMEERKINAIPCRQVHCQLLWFVVAWVSPGPRQGSCREEMHEETGP